MSNSALILVVDDSPIQRKIYSATLRSDGYEVIVAADGREGIEMALQHAPDLIVMDVSMPEMDGPTAVQELRRYPAMAQVPVLAVTAIADSADVEELYESGFDDVVDKNSDRAVLLERVHHWFSG